MPDQRLVDYIKSAKSMGYDDDRIQKALMTSGYPDYAIRDAYDEIYGQKTKSYVTKHMLQIGASIIAVIFVTLVILYFRPSCSSEACFIEYANSCSQAAFTRTEETALVQYATQDCITTKKITQIDDTEPQEIKDFFLNKEMSCKYEEGKFNAEIIKNFASSIELCDGTLKDAIISLRLAQLEATV